MMVAGLDARDAKYSRRQRTRFHEVEIRVVFNTLLTLDSGIEQKFGAYQMSTIWKSEERKNLCELLIFKNVAS